VRDKTTSKNTHAALCGFLHALDFGKVQCHSVGSVGKWDAIASLTISFTSIYGIVYRAFHIGIGIVRISRGKIGIAHPSSSLAIHIWHVRAAID
jgi:hypothetical protein